MKLQLTGRLHSITRDFLSNKIILSLLVNEDGFEVDQIQEDLDIHIRKHRKKRSLDANAYAWALMSKIATLQGTSKDEVYDLMLQRYGVLYEDEDGYFSMAVKKPADAGKVLNEHLLRYREDSDFNYYLVIKGTSEYDTSEMSHFIDGIVSECKELGIETMTPDELERMKAAWRSNVK